MRNTRIQSAVIPVIEGLESRRLMSTTVLDSVGVGSHAYVVDKEAVVASGSLNLQLTAADRTTGSVDVGGTFSDTYIHTMTFRVDSVVLGTMSRTDTKTTADVRDGVFVSVARVLTFTRTVNFQLNADQLSHFSGVGQANVIVDLASVHKMSVSGGSGSIRAGQSSQVGGKSTVNLVPPASAAETLSKGQLKKATRLFSQQLIESL